MVNMFNRLLLAFIGLLFFVTSALPAEDKPNFTKFPTGQSMQKSYDTLFHNRAIETYIWSMPAMGVTAWKKVAEPI